MNQPITVEYTYLSTTNCIPLKVPSEHNANDLAICTLVELARVQIPLHINTWTDYNAQVPVTNVVFKIDGNCIHDLGELMEQLPNDVVRISGNLMKNNE